MEIIDFKNTKKNKGKDNADAEKSILLNKAITLSEALPYIKKFSGEIFVIKFGGNAMGNKSIVEEFAKDVVLLKKIGINPGAAYGNAKMWTKEGFAEVIAHLSKENKIIIFGAKCENFYTEADEGKFNFPNIVNLSGRTNVQELVSEISDLDLFITGDSGPMHIAAAFQIPTISIFGPTKFQETSQWKNKFSKIIKKDLECQPCMKRTCPLKHHNCMKLIKPEEVLNEYQSLLREIEID